MLPLISKLQYCNENWIREEHIYALMALPLSSRVTLNKFLISENQLPTCEMREWGHMVSLSTPALPIGGLCLMACGFSGSFAVEKRKGF